MRYLLLFLLCAGSLLARPTIWLVGDSTVNCGTSGMYGWGQVISPYFDADKATVVNKAIGGRSSRTFITEGRWEAVLEELQPGDYVLIQFGHNDSTPVNDNHRARGSLEGTGEETEEIDNMLTGKHETVYTYGHYMRQYVQGSREKGAIPVICSLVPREWWEDGRVTRDEHHYATWAREVAREEEAHFVDLNEIIARRYEELGPEQVAAFFADEFTHHTAAGAMFNAAAVISGLKGLAGQPFDPLFSPLAGEVQPFPPLSWIDPVSGRKITRLSKDPGTASLYFHQNPFTPEGDKMVVTTPDGIGTIDLETGELSTIVPGRAWVLVVGRKSRSIYYIRREEEERLVCKADIDTGRETIIAQLPSGAGVSSLNADETLLLGSMTEEPPEPLVEGQADANRHGGGRAQGEWMRETRMTHPVTGRELTFAEQKEWRLNARLEARIPMAMFVIDTATGELSVIHRATDWLNHLQFSPTDPDQIMFCHEGPWHKVDRIWIIRTDGTGLKKIHTRTMNMEIAGHEFFSPDGKTIWYDLQTPRGEDFWLAGYELETGRRTWYHLERNEWSVHFNISPDQTLFAGDGGDDEMVAHAPDGKYIYLFRPEPIPDVAGISADNAESLIHPGVLRSEKLVDMSNHDYRLEPNIHFTPDGKRLIFRSNMHGATHVYAVEIGE